MVELSERAHGRRWSERSPVEKLVALVVIGALFMALVGGLVTFAMAASEDGTEAGPEIPFLAEWRLSGHAFAESEAFRHWDEDGEVPTQCAKCHTTTGMLDFLGLDVTPVGFVDTAHAPGQGIECTACHNPAARAATSARLPSGFVAEGLGRSSICVECHQGRASTPALRASIEALPRDEVSAEVGFTNPHYLAAGPTLFGGAGEGAFQYQGRLYAWRTPHPPSVRECAQCHDPHKLDVQIETCGACHEGIEAAADLRKARFEMADDFDGDGNTAEGLADEVEGLRTRLEAAVRIYAAEVAGKPVAVKFDAYPYFFLDTDGDGVAAEEEATFANRYDAWTPRLVAAAYNLAYASKEPGAYAHNPRYILQVLYDSIADLGDATAVTAAGLVRPE